MCCEKGCGTERRWRQRRARPELDAPALSIVAWNHSCPSSQAVHTGMGQSKVESASLVAERGAGQRGPAWTSAPCPMLECLHRRLAKLDWSGRRVCFFMRHTAAAASRWCPSCRPAKRGSDAGPCSTSRQLRPTRRCPLDGGRTPHDRRAPAAPAAASGAAASSRGDAISKEDYG
jgi:hypothetical protein